MTGGGSLVKNKNEQVGTLDTHLAVKDEKSSVAMLEVERSDRIRSSAIFSTALISSFSTCQRCGRSITKYSPPLPKNTLNEGSISVAVAPRHLPPDHHPQPASGGAQKASCSYRRRKRETPTYKPVSRLSRGTSVPPYVFQAPDISITASRLSSVAASVRFRLSGCQTPPPRGMCRSSTYSIFSLGSSSRSSPCRMS